MTVLSLHKKNSSTRGRFYFIKGIPILERYFYIETVFWFCYFEKPSQNTSGRLLKQNPTSTFSICRLHRFLRVCFTKDSLSNSQLSL